MLYKLGAAPAGHKRSGKFSSYMLSTIKSDNSLMEANTNINKNNIIKQKSLLISQFY